MAKYRITAPDGKVFDVEGDGTQEEALAHFQANYKPQEINAGNVLEKAAPYYLGPAGPARAISEASNALDRLAYKGGAAVNDLAVKVLPPAAAAGLGTGANLAIQTVPLVLGGEAAKLASPALEGSARWLMQSSLKPTLENLRSGNAARAIDTMLKEGYNATNGGLNAMKARISDLGNEVAQAVANSTQLINKNAVADRLRGLLDRVSQQVNPNADIAAVQKAWTEFLNHPALAGRATMTVPEAQAMKQATYRELGSKSYGEIGTADTEAQKQLARGLKEEISSAVPAVAGPNAKQAELLNAAGILERRMLMQSNNNPLGLAALRMDSPLAALSFLADKSALAKSLLARALFSGSEQIPALAGRSFGALYGAQLGQPPEQGVLYR